jgi:SOS-response transcriptional repressor LexA
MPYFIHVRGDSMSGVGIYDGYLVLINPNAEVYNGNPAYVECYGVRSIKGYISYPDGHIELRPANPSYQPTYVTVEDATPENFRILGKVVRWLNMGKPGNVT